MPELLVRGGTVVTAEGSKRADVHVRDGSIAAVEADLRALADAGSAEVVDATGMLVLVGIAAATVDTSGLRSRSSSQATRA